MKKWLVLCWLLIPVALLGYHFGPGQQALAFRQAEQQLDAARELEANGHFEAAIESYAESLAALPDVAEPSTDLVLARDQLRLAPIRGRFQPGKLAESIESLNALILDVEDEYGAHSEFAYDVRDFLALH